jgi:hypothetical protein
MDFLEFLSEIKGFIITFIVICIMIGIGVYHVDKQTCLVSYENYKPQYSFFGGCRVNWNERITPVDIIREIK